MFNGLPTNSRRLVKLVLSLAWSFAGGAGLSSVLRAPISYVRELGQMWTLVFGAILVIATLCAVIGVTTGRYRWEWTASYLASASLVPYAGVLWATVLLGHPSTLPQAFLVTSLVMFFILRGLLCAAHAAVLRRAYVVTTTAPVQIVNEGESDGGDVHTGD
jgi:hypothetical protein